MHMIIFIDLLGASQFNQWCYYFPQSTTWKPSILLWFLFLQDPVSGSSLVIVINLICIYLFLCYLIDLIIQKYLCYMPFLRHGMGSIYNQHIAEIPYNLKNWIMSKIRKVSSLSFPSNFSYPSATLSVFPLWPTLLPLFSSSNHAAYPFQKTFSKILFFTILINYKCLLFWLLNKFPSFKI